MLTVGLLDSFLGIPFQRWDDVFLAVGIFMIVLGVWLRNQILEVQMVAEEDVKSRKLSADEAKSRVRNRTRLVNLIIVAGIGFTMGAVLILVIQSELAFMVPS